MKFRRTSALAAAVLAAGGLTACKTNIGTAAYVGGHRITETDVNDYLTPTGAKNTAQTVSPRALVLEYLIEQKVFEDTLKSLGPLPNEGVLASYHDAVASVLLQTSLTGEQLDAAINKGLPNSGVRGSFTSVYLRTSELEYAIIKKKKLTKPSELAALVHAAGVKVSVSPRYGTWHAATLSLDGKPPVPSYLSVAPGQQAQPGTK